jgi:hypothetical protein
VEDSENAVGVCHTDTLKDDTSLYIFVVIYNVIYNVT